MAIEVKVIGNGHFQGSGTNLTSYSVSEDSTPIDGSDSTGGVGSIDFGIIEDPASDGTILLLSDTVQISDGSNGRTTGIVKSVSSNDGNATVSADSRLGQLMAERTAQPYTGTLQGAFLYYLGLAGIASGVVVDSSIASRPVVYQGFVGNLWDNMKLMCIAEGVEISLVSNNIVLRPLRTRVAEIKKWSSSSWSVQNIELARTIEVYAYQNSRVVNGLVYPRNGWNEDVQVYSVDAGQTLEVDIPVDVSLESVLQPLCQFNVSREYVGPNSVYAVAGKDGLPIPPAQWTAQGGDITLSIGEDTKTIKMVITGATEIGYSPYRIAVSSGPSDAYSSLRIVGTGVFYDKKLISVPTGAPLSKTAVDVGVTVDNPFISTIEEAYSVAMKVAGKYASAAQTINISATVINRAGEPGSLVYPLFRDFDAIQAGKTFGQFDTDMGTMTFGDFTDQQFALVADTFANQAFGNVAGARVKFRDSWYRIRNATITPDNINFSAERDTIFSDFNDAWTGKTFAQFNARWSGKTFEEFGVVSLWT